MAIQVDLVAAVAKGSSFCVLFHGLDPSRRNAFQSSAEACKMQLMKPVGVTAKRQYTMSAPLGWRVCTVWIVVLLGSHFSIVCKQRLQAVEGIGAATAASFSKACLPPIYRSARIVIHQKLKVRVSVAQCLLGVALGCPALDFRRCRMQSAGDTNSTFTVSS